MTAARHSAPAPAITLAARPASGVRPAVRLADAFVGRAADLARLVDLLDAGHHLVTVTGPPGVGKTRLARQLLTMEASDAADAPPPAWCRLAEAHNIDEMAAAVAQALHRDPAAAPPGDPVERIGAALAAHGGLVVLDNVEHLLDVLSAALPRWLERAPTVRLVATSRARLGVDEEVVHALGPLSLPDEDGTGADESEAVALFVQRARKVAPDFTTSDADRPLLAQVVRALDGLPLAIELAAARVGVLGLADLLARLERRFEVLRRARAAPADPHAALRVAIDGSWELLGAAERSVLSQCAVFRGGFTLEAAESVLVVPGPPGDEEAPSVLDVLDVLQRHSLIVSRAPVDEPHKLRFVLLESVRDYALAALERSGERAAASARHAAWYAARATHEAAALDHTPGLDGLRWLARERANVVAGAATFLEPAAGPGGARRALETLLALEPWADAYGYWDGYGAMLESALRRVCDGSVEASGPLELRARLAWLRWRRSVAPSEEIAEGCHEVLARARALSDGRLAAGALLEVGGCVQYARPGEARAAYERAIAEYVAAGDRRGEARARIALGTVCHRLGLAARAGAEAKRAADLLDALGDARGRARAFTLLSLALGELGDFERLRAVAGRALPTLAAYQDRRWEAFCVLGLGLAAQAAGAFPSARAHFEKAFHLARQVGDTRLTHCRDVCLGRLDHERGDLTAAIEAYQAGLPALSAVGDRTTEGLFEAYLGAALAARDDISGASAAFDRADSLLAGRTVPALHRAAALLRGHLDLALARADAKRGCEAAAAPHRRTAEDRLRTFDPRGRAPAAGDDDTPSSEDLFVAARMLAGALGDSAPPPAPTVRSRRILTIGPGGRWFQVEDGAPCHFRRQRALRDLLLGLVELRERAPGKAARLPELFRMGWPDERARPESAANRVYVTLSRLRAMGLGGLMVSRDDGWLLDPSLVVQRAEADI